MKRFLVPYVVVSLVCSVLAGSAGATTAPPDGAILPSTTFSLYQDGIGGPTAPVVPVPGEIGLFEGVIGRAFAEFPLAGENTSLQRNFSLKISSFGSSLFTPDLPYFGPVRVVAYGANGLADDSDFEITGAVIGSLDTSGASVGDRYKFDVSNVFEAASTLGFSHLGMRVQRVNEFYLDDDGAVVFDHLQINVVPIPASLPLTVTGLLALWGAGFRRRRV